MWLRGEIKEQQNKMTVLLTALITADHMVENSKYGERQSNIILHISVCILSSSPMRAGLHLIKSFNLDHLDSAALFTTLHLGNATTCAAVPPLKPSDNLVSEKAKRRVRKRTYLVHSILLCHQQWRGKSYSVQSGTVRFGFCF